MRWVNLYIFYLHVSTGFISFFCVNLLCVNAITKHQYQWKWLVKLSMGSNCRRLLFFQKRAKGRGIKRIVNNKILVNLIFMILLHGDMALQNHRILYRSKCCNIKHTNHLKISQTHCIPFQWTLIRTFAEMLGVSNPLPFLFFCHSRRPISQIIITKLWRVVCKESKKFDEWFHSCS